MKKFFFAILLLFAGLFANAQDAKWAELEAFHKVMSQTFHPAEEGDMGPVMARSGELAQKAKDLKKSAIPSAYQTKAVKTSLKGLAKQSALVDKMVKKGKPEAEIKQALFVAHDRFHDVMGACSH